MKKVTIYYPDRTTCVFTEGEKGVKEIFTNRNMEPPFVKIVLDSGEVQWNIGMPYILVIK